VEIQAGHDPELETRVLEYNVLLDHRDQLPVRSIVVRMRLSQSQADLHTPSSHRSVASSG